MKKLACEICGSSELRKQDGVFVCQSCGCQYDAEEVKKMMIEGVVQVSGTVTVDNSAQVANFIQLAEHAQEAGNHLEAEGYCNKAIEIDPANYRAWLIKGAAAGWQSTGRRDRIGEAVECFAKAIDNAPEEELEGARKRIADEVSELSLASIKMHCDLFVKFPSEGSADDVAKAALSAKINVANLLLKCGVAPTEFQTQAAKVIDEATSIANEILLVGQEHIGDACIAMWLTAIEMADGDDQANLKRYERCISKNNFICLLERSPSAKALREKLSDEWRAEVERLSDKVRNSPEVIARRMKIEEATLTPEFSAYIDARIERLRRNKAYEKEKKKLFANSKKITELRESVAECATACKEFEDSEAWVQFMAWDTEVLKESLSNLTTGGASKGRIKIDGYVKDDVIESLKSIVDSVVRWDSVFEQKGEKELILTRCYLAARVLEKYAIPYKIL